MQTDFVYSSLLISESSEVIQKFTELSAKIEITHYIEKSILEALEHMMDYNIDSIIIDTGLGEENVISFLNHIGDDFEYKQTPIIIISEQHDYNYCADKTSEFNIVSILSNRNWQVQAKKLLKFFKMQKGNLQSLENNLVKSEGRSVIDPLTGSYNRYGAQDTFNRLTSRYKAYDENFCLIILDIDHFKSVNDNHGHDIGDEVLVGISKLLQKSIRKDDALIRLGGEEFVIFMSNIDINIAIRNSEKMRQMIAATAHSSKYLDITASFGVVQYIPNEELESILKRADELLYKAKNNGRNRVEFLNG